MQLVKVDSVTGKRLAGAGFTIYDSQQNVVHSLVSNDNGETNAVAMRPGTYYIQETVAPDGYLRPMSTWTLEITEEGDIRCDNVKGVNYDREKRLLTLTVANQRTKGNLLIYKHDADDKTVALEGARFRLIDEAGNAVKFTVKNGVSHADTAGNVNSFTTGADGKIHIEQLPVGEYKLYELEAPVGYAAWTETPILVKLTHADEEMHVDVANEKEQRRVRVVKEDSDGVKLIGAEFTLYNTDGQSPIPVAKGTTGSDGIVEFQVTYGSYQIFETAAPAGHELIQGPVASFTFDEDTGEEETFTFTVVNAKSKYALEVYKHEKGNPNKGLKGAEFAVTNSLGFTKVITTGADGIARLDDIVYDDYTIREVKAPEGYYLTDQTYTVKRTDLVHGAVLRYEFANEPVIGAVYLKKVDHMNREKLLNAEFTVTDQKGNVLLWEKTAAGYRVSTTGTKTILAGNVKLEGLPMGTYTIKEVKAPEGYIILEESREFSITEKNALAEIVIEITNLQRMTAVGIVKMDADKLSERLAGAEFTVYPLLPNGREGAAIKSVVTDQTGMAIFNDLTVGTYRIRETKAPYGYEMVVKAVDFKIQEDGKVVLLNNNAEVSAPNQVHLIGVTNKAIQKDFVISKVCAVTGKVLKGATFTITGGNTSVELTTGTDGLAKVKLPYGEYVLQEVIAPDGYVRDTEKHLLKVSANGVTVDGKLLNGFTYVVRNVPVKIPVILHKQDKCGRNPLKDAEFTITGYCTELKLKTDANGNTKLFYLEPGDYKITETVAPKGYVKPLTSWVLRVTKDGKMCAVGSYAIRASDCGTMIIILENEKADNGGGSGGSGGGGGYGGGSGGSGGGGGSVSVSGITKTGETFNRTMFASGVALTMLSAMGLVVLYLDERKRRRMLMS